MKVSIIIPVYKVEKYIIRCLESVKAQTFTDYEVILVDDCGGDNSIALAESYCEQYFPNNHKIIHHDHNKGLSEARNTGVRNCSGEFIYFLDSDDEITNHCLDKLIRYANDDVDFVMARYRNEPIAKELYNFPKSGYFSKNELISLYITRSIPWNSVNRIINRRIFTEQHVYFDEGITSEDLMWNYRSLEFVSKCYLINEVTYIYHINPGSIMTSTSYNYKYANDLICIADKMKGIAFNTSNPLIINYYHYIRYSFIPYAIYWHNYPAKFRTDCIKRLFHQRFDKLFKNLPWHKKLFFHLPSSLLAVSYLASYKISEYTEILKSKLHQ